MMILTRMYLIRGDVAEVDASALQILYEVVESYKNRGVEVNLLIS